MTTDLMPVFTAHSSDRWAAMESRLDAYAADRCVSCGECGDGPECAACTADWDATVARSTDL